MLNEKAPEEKTLLGVARQHIETIMSDFSRGTPTNIMPNKKNPVFGTLYTGDGRSY